MHGTPAIRPRNPDDDAAIAAILASAFDGSDEVALVDALRRDGAMSCEFVALAGDADLVGYVAFSNLDVRAGSRTLRAAALAPLAVAPKCQRQGIGDRLTRHALTRLSGSGYELAVVLGHPAYYARFGFSAQRAERLAAPYSGKAFMALELSPRALGDATWQVEYPRAFSSA